LLGIAVTGVLLLFTYAVTHTKVSTTVSVQYAGTIAASFLLGSLFFKEKITGVKLVALLLVGCGLVLYAHAELSFNLAMVAAFLSGIFDASTNALRKSLAAYNLSRTLLLQYQYMVAIVFMVVIMTIDGGPYIKDVSLMAILATAAFVALLIVSGNLLFYGFKHFDVNGGAIILASEIFFAAVLAYLFFDELPTRIEAVGALLIFGAALLSTVDMPLIARKKQIILPSKSE
jgi:drug/metabolite transporter (DMT)-like permease